MKKIIVFNIWLWLAAGGVLAGPADDLFTGRVEATLARGGEVQTIIYTAGTNCLRIERGETDHPYARNLINRQTGEITLLFPHNRSYVVLKPAGEGAPAQPGMPGLPPSMPPMGGAAGAMPMMPVPQEPPKLTATGEETNLLGYACRRYELKQPGEVMEIWAATTNVPFARWLPNQPPRFGPPMLEEQWSGLVAAQKLFPVQAVLRFENGREGLRYQVKSVRPQPPAALAGGLFLPPEDYLRLEPLPF